jgi:hypothetical protein
MLLLSVQKLALFFQIALCQTRIYTDLPREITFLPISRGEHGKIKNRKSQSVNRKLHIPALSVLYPLLFINSQYSIIN